MDVLSISIEFNLLGRKIYMRIGIDVGGSHVGLGLVDKNGKLVNI